MFLLAVEDLLSELKITPCLFFHVCSVHMSDVCTGQVGCYLKRAIIFETKKFSATDLFESTFKVRICAEPVQAYFLMLSE